MGLHIKKKLSESFLGELTEKILRKSDATIFVYKPIQPIATIIRHFVLIPENAEQEAGFPFWLLKVWNIARHTGAEILFYATEKTLEIIKDIHKSHPIDAKFNIFNDWDDFLILSRHIKNDDNLIVILSRENHPSHHKNMKNVSKYLNEYFQTNSFILVFPVQFKVTDSHKINLNYPSMLEPIEKLDELGKTIAGLFKRR